VSQKISALIITYNEEDNISEVLKSLEFADEIILVDSFSTDRTLELARLHPKVKIYQNKFEDFTKQRNLALTYASNDWVLFLDADERLTKACQTEIVETINFSGTQNDKNFRLFKKSKATYDTKKKVHETLIVNGTIGSLKNKIWHYSFADYTSYKEKMVHYGALKGKELYAKNKRYSLLSHLAKVSFKFFKAYFLKLGILDGRRGYQLCYLQSLSVHETFMSLKREEKR